MYSTRRLLAVPFVGKDVPSRASEFAHPDITIGCSSLFSCSGLSILAYRYEGVRPSDFKEVLKSLQLKMLNETGPFPQRKACRTFVAWVNAAGGRVRGQKT